MLSVREVFRGERRLADVRRTTAPGCGGLRYPLLARIGEDRVLVSVDGSERETDAANLQGRVRRIERVVVALRARAVYRHPVTGKTPTPLLEAIAAFERERDRVRRRIDGCPPLA